jgi:excinuclease ABC subunit A
MFQSMKCKKNDDRIPPGAASHEAAKAFIACTGVRTHNLKNLNLEIPLGRWIAVTGVSGSGKSSLVFDTIFAEAQRRFLETLGTYERQFLQGLPAGEFDSIDHVPAAVALKQTNRATDPRSVIGSSADVFDPLRLSFLTLMDDSCARCGSPAETHLVNELVEWMKKEFDSFAAQRAGEELCSYKVLAIPFKFSGALKERLQILESFVLEGISKVVVGDRLEEIDELRSDKKKIEACPEDILVVLDRMSSDILADELRNRADSVWSQVRFSNRFSNLQVLDFDPESERVRAEHIFRVQPFCPTCNDKTQLIQSGDLDWQSVLGGCRTCRGLGNVPVLDETKIIPDPRLSLEDNAIKPWSSDVFGWMKDELLKACRSLGIPIHVPWSQLSETQKALIWSGVSVGTPTPGSLKTTSKTSKRPQFVSIEDFFAALEAERYKQQSRILLAKYRRYVTCTDCGGTRLGAAGRQARCRGVRYSDLMHGDIGAIQTWMHAVESEQKYASRLGGLKEIWNELARKIDLLKRLGLGSSALSRRCKTLSGGEYQRVLLTRVIGNGLTDALYVLDEPSVGLGRAEIPELVACLRELRDLGNTVLMVEHDPELIRNADVWFELGPGGGSRGGELVPQVSDEPQSVFLDRSALGQTVRRRMAVGEDDAVADAKSALRLSGFSMHNCKDLNLEIPFGCLTVIGGPSGAGKSTLVNAGLEAALDWIVDTGQTSNERLDVDEGRGIWTELRLPKNFLDTFDVVSVEQKAMHRTITSVPATVLGLMDQLRRVFSQTPEAKNLDLMASDFSFNGAGACEECGGKGFIREDLFFLGEVDKQCPECTGSRYRKESLQVSWKGKTIQQWLETSLDDCYVQLNQETGFSKPLAVAVRLGLGHLPLGVPTTFMSGGEAQRLRLAAALTKGSRRLFCILDEPTRGLSEKDVGQLLKTLRDLAQQGHTFVVVEHHQAFQDFSDQLILLGPGSGQEGGQIVQRECVSMQN